MLDQLFQDPGSLGMAQAAITTIMALGVILLARRQNIHLERETLVALLRGFVQVIVVGSVLQLAGQGASPVLSGYRYWELVSAPVS